MQTSFAHNSNIARGPMPGGTDVIAPSRGPMPGGTDVIEPTVARGPMPGGTDVI